MTDLNNVIAQWEEFFALRIKRRKDLAAGYIRYVSRLASADVPPIFELRHLSAMIGVERLALASFINSGSYFYREFRIPKKLGGERVIEVPTPELLYVQRWILSNILVKVPIHSSAHGFTKGRSVLSNASVHVGAPYLLKIDLKDFFASIPLKRGVKSFLKIGFPPNVSFYLASICFSNGRLPQGAATSPALSNIIARQLDVRLAGLASANQLRYTRYADDISLSGQSLPNGIVDQVSYIVENAGFIINTRKTRLIGPSSKKIVTGVSISSGRAAMPRAKVRELKKSIFFLTKYGFDDYCTRTDSNDPIVFERLL